MTAAADPSSSSAPSAGLGRNLPSPWAHVVRGEPESAFPSSPPPPSPPVVGAIPLPEGADRSPLAAAAAASDDPPTAAPPDGGDNGGGAGALSPEKKSAWSRPANGAAEPVMGAVSWPALSEATKASPKLSSSDTLKALPDGSVFAPPAPVVSSPGQSKPISSSVESNSSTTYAGQARQKSSKRAGGSSSGSAFSGKGGTSVPNGRMAPPQMPPHSAEAALPGKPASLEQSTRHMDEKGIGSWDHGPMAQLHGGNEHQRGYGGNKRGGSGGPGGRGSHHGPWSRRDQERGAYDWNHRPFGGGRDVQMQQRPQHQARPTARPFLRPPLVSAPFIAPPHRMSSFGGPLGYYDVPSPFYYLPTPPPESLGGMPFVAPPGMCFAAPDPQLQSALAKQIEYYFSPENLCKDIYLRQNMDGEGWVPISLIAGFNRVRNLTNNIQFILDAVKASAIVEVWGDRIRKRNDWMNWPALASVPNLSHSSETPYYDSLVAQVRNVGLDDGSNSQTIMGGAINAEVLQALNCQTPTVIIPSADESRHNADQTAPYQRRA